MKNYRSWTLMLALALGMLVINAVPSAAAKDGHSLIVGKRDETTLSQSKQIGSLTLKPGPYRFRFQTGQGSLLALH